MRRRSPSSRIASTSRRRPPGRRWTASSTPPPSTRRGCRRAGSGPAATSTATAAAIPPRGRRAGGSGAGSHTEGDRHGPPRGGSDPAGELPPGTYGERRDASGKVLGSQVICCTTPALARPELPPQMGAGDVATVEAVRGDTTYRARAFANPGGEGVTV